MVAQGDVADAKGVTRYLGVAGGGGLAALAVDLSQRGEDLTVSAGGLSEAGAQARWMTTDAGAWEAVVQVSTLTTGYIYAYESGGLGVRMVMVAGGTVEAYVDNTLIASVTIPGLGAVDEQAVVAWSMHPHALTSGAADAVRSELRVYRGTDYAQDVATHAAVSSVAATALWGIGTVLGANALSGTMEQLRFTAGRFVSATETREDFVATSAAPTMTLQSRREVAVPPTSLGLGDHGEFAGLTYQAVAAGLHQADLRQASALVSHMPATPEDLSDDYPTARSYAAANGVTMLGQYLRYVPVPRTCNRMRARVHIQSWRTDANPDDTVVVRMYSMSAPPLGFAGVVGPAAAPTTFFRDVAVTADHGSGSTGGEWLEFSLLEVAREPDTDATWLCLGFRVDNPGGAGQVANQRWRVRAWTVEPGVISTIGEIPLGGS